MKKNNNIRHMSKFRLALCLAIMLILSGCKNPFSFTNPFGGGGGGDDDRESVQPDRVTEPTQKFYLAIGGVAPGRDELIIYNSYGSIQTFPGNPLECEAADEDLVKLQPRPEYNTLSDGSGAQIVPLLPGVTAIRCWVGDVNLDYVYEVTIPPQSMIQILVAEAGLQIADEATLDDEYDDDIVELTSESPTATALASVIRNRIELINDLDDPDLFNADEEEYDEDAPTSYYDAVIFANGQFSPTSPSDQTYDIFVKASLRKFMDDDYQIAYDQAVITAAQVFNGDKNDNTDGAFAFRSPTDDEWDILSSAWNEGASQIPENSGFTDEDFPSLDPIQILIQPDVWTYSDGRPAFVFARERLDGEFAIENTP
ncbi:MAG: hypothetical protein HN337_03650 [Deltaproteobacteria bacterium]|jgi:hypothetical protein|nr:hypothetical protein [Deltaproteobacteria bacterium]